MKPVLFLVMALVWASLFSCSQETPDPPSSQGYLKICHAFDALKKLEKLASMTPTQRNEFIVAKLIKAAPNSNAKISWDAVSSAAPEDRYEIFQYGADSLLNTNWECESMKQLVSSTGQY